MDFIHYLLNVWLATGINTTDKIGVSDKVELLNEATRDITLLLIVGIVGIIIYFLRKYIEKFEIFLQQHIKADSESLPRKTKYDDLSLDKLEKIRGYLTRNFAILITIFGILFAFIISENLSRAFVSWSFIIWTGWILAIIIRAGITALDLTDILEIKEKTDKFYLPRRLFAAKTFFRHSLYLLVPTLAFLPAIYFPLDIEADLQSLSWDKEIAVGSIAFAIIGVFLFVYLVAARISDFETSKGIEGFWIFTIILIIMGGLSYVSASPLSIESFKIFNNLVQTPNVIFVSLYMIFFGGLISLMVFFMLLAHRLYAVLKTK